MKNLRLKILLILSLISIGMIIYSWIQNSYQIDFFATKNHHIRALMIYDMQQSNNIDSVKNKALEIVNLNDKIKISDSNRAIKESKVLVYLFLTLLIIVILIIIEIKKTPHNTRYKKLPVQ
jgi:hypothetical protein